MAGWNFLLSARDLSGCARLHRKIGRAAVFSVVTFVPFIQVASVKEMGHCVSPMSKPPQTCSGAWELRPLAQSKGIPGPLHCPRSRRVDGGSKALNQSAPYLPSATADSTRVHCNKATTTKTLVQHEEILTESPPRAVVCQCDCTAEAAPV